MVPNQKPLESDALTIDNASIQRKGVSIAIHSFHYPLVTSLLIMDNTLAMMPFAFP
jgi:hypothetical protein